jgi:hypothetical protein
MTDQESPGWEGATLHFDCDPNDAVFFTLVQQVMLRSIEQTRAVVEAFKEATDHLQGVDDDRALILVCALLLENGIEGCLDAIAPKYKQIASDRDLTFSMKTSFLKVLCLIPPQVIDAITPIRKIRNAFAHELHVKTFDSVDAPLFEALETQRQRLLPDARKDISRREAVVDTTKNILIGLQLFRLHLGALRQFLGTADFRRFFGAFCKATYE